MLDELIIGKKYTVKVDGCLTFRGLLVARDCYKLHFMLNKTKKNVIVDAYRVEVLRQWK